MLDSDYNIDAYFTSISDITMKYAQVVLLGVAQALGSRDRWSDAHASN
jgi:hypothetical protein